MFIRPLDAKGFARRPTSRRRRNARVRAAITQVQPLEDRRLLAYSVGPDGWTTFTPSADSRVIYVSTSGSDSNSGLSESQPLRTINAAKSLIRAGRPDWVLLKRGDVFTNETLGVLRVSGRSPQEPIYFGAYGTGNRPILRVGSNDGFATLAGNATALNYVAIQGLHFIDHTHTGNEKNAGIRFQRKGSHVYIEDVKVENFKDGMVFAGETQADAVSNITIRRSVIIDNWSKSSNGHAQGIYGSGVVNGLTIEENVIDRNGWKEGVPGAEKTVYNHNIYINDGAQNVVIRNNISTRASLRGILTRGGGVVTGNFTARNAIGIETWGDATITNNVVLENGDIPNFPQGFGIQVKAGDGDVVIDNNVIAHDWSDFTYNVFGIRIWNGLNSAVVTNNIIYNWRRPFFYDTYGRNTQLTVQGNHFQIDDDFHPVVAHTGTRQTNVHDYGNNVYYSPRSQPMWHQNGYQSWTNWRNYNGGEDDSTFQRQTYTDPNRGLGDYNASLGGSNSFDAFLAAARNLSRQNYNTNYTAAPAIAFIRAGFNLGQITGPTVTVSATDDEAAEPAVSPPSAANPGTFTITRSGPTDAALVVSYAFGGNATYGVDYTTLLPESGTITFAPGQASVQVEITPLGDAIAENPETVDFRLLYSGSYNLGAPSIATINIEDGNGGTIPPTYGGGIDPRGGGFIGYPYDPVNNGTGLKGEYFDNADFTNKLLQRLDLNVNFDWGAGAPVSTPLAADTFSVRWTGEMAATNEYEGNVTFRIQADNAVRLWVDDLLIIDTMSAGRFPGDANQDGIVNIADFSILAANFNLDDKAWEHGDFDGDGTVGIADFSALAANFNKPAPGLQPGDWEGTIFLESNNRYDIRLDYVEFTGNANVRLFWSTPFAEEQIVPTAVLFAPSDVAPNGGSFGEGERPSPLGVAAAPPTPAGGTRTGLFSDAAPIADEVL